MKMNVQIVPEKTGDFFFCILKVNPVITGRVVNSRGLTVAGSVTRH